MDNIRPSSDLRNKYNEMSELCRTTKKPVYLTVNGRGDTVLLNITYFNEIIEELELLRELAESEADVENDRIAPIENTFNDIRKRLATK